jgi:hypothetical protein
MVKAEHAAKLKLASNNVNPLQLDDPSMAADEMKDDNEEPDIIKKPTKFIGWKKPTGPHDIHQSLLHSA